MKLVYICSPLRGDGAFGMSTEQNIIRAHEYCAYAADCGVIPLAPHTIFTNYLDDKNPEQRRQGLNMGLELLKRCDEMWIMGGVLSEGMKGEIALAEKENIPRLYVADEMVQANYKIRQSNKPFEYSDCIPGSEKANYENQILVLKPEVYENCGMTADDSLWVASHGYGCTYGARGQSVFTENLLSGEKIRWERHDFCGIVEPLRLFSWLSDKPVRNERAEEVLRDMEFTLTAEEAVEEETEAEP